MPPITLLLFFSLIAFQGVIGAHSSHNRKSLIDLSGTSNSQPDPLASTYPNNVTGTVNQTIVVVPIPYSLARCLIPEKYNILSNYAAMLPGFPSNMYPLVIEGKLDHDVQISGIGSPDFTSVQFNFPFIDLLGDGYSTFRYMPTLIISNNPVAIAGVALYGPDVIVANFDPPSDPYAYAPASQSPAPGAIYFNATSPLDQDDRYVSAIFAPLASGDDGPYPLSLLVKTRIPSPTNDTLFQHTHHSRSIRTCRYPRQHYRH
ncbi:hypothetical protein FRB95_011023 [Tulasnella sp. JGI-2019a]|nr:hypothetical protein FRB95_011023 [Tulasnella sp. JGI-2019a]